MFEPVDGGTSQKAAPVPGLIVFRYLGQLFLAYFGCIFVTLCLLDPSLGRAWRLLVLPLAIGIGIGGAVRSLWPSTSRAGSLVFVLPVLWLMLLYLRLPSPWSGVRAFLTFEADIQGAIGSLGYSAAMYVLSKTAGKQSRA